MKSNNKDSNITKYKGAHILKAPVLPKYPNMVQIIKTSKKLNSLRGKKYVDIDKAMIQIDLFDTNRLIERNKIRATKDLVDLGLSDKSY